MSRIILRSLFVVGALLLASAHARAQQIQGQVRYADTNQPAINITVRCDGIGGNSIQMTDASGKFYFRVSPGHYTVTVRIPGYREEQLSYDLTDANSNEYAFIKLKPDGTAKAPPAAGATGTADPNVPAEARKEFEKAETALAGEKKEKIEEGVAHLEKAVQIYPKYLDAELRRGAAYMDLKQWDKAEQALKHALEIDPKAANADFALGELYLQQKKYAEAEQALKAGLAIEDRSYEGHLSLARLYWSMGAATKDEAQMRPALENSFQEVNKALELKPDLADAHLLKGNLLLRARRAQDAQAEFEEYLRLAPNGQFAPQARDLVAKIKQALANSKP